MNTIRAILIDPFAKSVTEVQVQTGLKHFYELLGCDLVDVVRFGNGVDGWLDDEGLFKDPQAFFTIGAYPQPLAGKVLLCSHDEEGNTMPAHDWLTVERVFENIEWHGELSMEDRPQPEFSISTW